MGQGMGQGAKKEAFLREPRAKKIVVLEELDFVWDEYELMDLEEMWNQELTITYMADYFKRNPDEIVIALFHLSREEKICRRKSGVFEGIQGSFQIGRRKRKYSQRKCKS